VAGPALHYAATGQADPAAVGDEPLPGPVIDRAARALAIGLQQLAHIYAPEVIALGGGVIDHHPELVAQTATHFAEHRSRLIPAALRIIRAPLSTREAGVIGAALLALGRGA
jgi:predicted NBD/HSP70 family sugar kinase